MTRAHTGPGERSCGVLCGLAGGAAVAAAVVLIVAGHKAPAVAPATVFLQSLRGPERVCKIDAGKPAVLVFDISRLPDGQEYDATIVDSLGAEILKQRRRRVKGVSPYR